MSPLAANEAAYVPVLPPPSGYAFRDHADFTAPAAAALHTLQVPLANAGRRLGEITLWRHAGPPFDRHDEEDLQRVATYFEHVLRNAPELAAGSAGVIEDEAMLLATVDGRRLAVGNARLLEREGIAQDGLASHADELAGQGRTSVRVAIDGQAAAVIAVADAPRETAAQAVAELKDLGIRAVMLSGDSRATAEARLRPSPEPGSERSEPPPAGAPHRTEHAETDDCVSGVEALARVLTDLATG